MFDTEWELRMDRGFARKVEYQQLIRYTNDFSEENILGTFQFGKVYRGIITIPRQQHLMVKMWEDTERYHCFPGDNEARVMLEVVLLRHERLNSHPGMIEFYGYCWEEGHLGAVYKFNPVDTLHNLVPKDSFTWLQRFKVALGFAQLLKFLHIKTPPYSPLVVRNISAAHVVLDEQYNPKLFDFSMITGGILHDSTIYEDYYVYGSSGYIDPSIEWSGKWSVKTDVFAFGVLLLNLITNRVDKEEDRQSNAPLLYVWAWDLFESCQSENDSRTSMFSLVDQSLTTDPSFSFTDGCEITDLAMKCINRVADERPTMKQVVRYLLKLQVVKENAEFLGLAPKDDKLTPIDVVVSEMSALRV